MNNRAIFLLFFLAHIWPSHAWLQTHMTIQQAQKRLSELKSLKISKDEFETTDEFKAREARLLVERRNQIDALLDQSYPGTAQVVMGLYDADNEIYPAQLWLAGFSEKSIFKVPRAEAKLVKEHSSHLMAVGRFWLEYDGDVFLIGKLAIKIAGNEYFSEPGRNRLAIVKEGGVDTYEEHYSAVFSPEGKWLATAGVDGVNLWDTRGKKARVLSEGRGKFVTFSPDGKWIAAILSGESGLEIVTTLKIWNAGDMQLIRTISLGGMLDGYAAAFSPDGKWLAVGAAARDAVAEAFLNKSAKKGKWLASRTLNHFMISEVASGRSFREFNWNVASLAFSPDGQWLATAQSRGTALYKIKEMR
jgi:hypothetical protein